MVGHVACQPDIWSYSPTTALSVAALYTGAVCWTMFYDTVYAYQDIDDDQKIGVRSTALAWGKGTSGKQRLAAMALGFSGLLGTSLFAADLNPTVSLLGLGAVGSHILWQFSLIKNLENKHGECGLAFKSNTNLGLIVLMTIIAGRYFQ